MTRLVRFWVAMLGLGLAFSSEVASAATECNQTMSGKIVGGVVVNAGDFCMLSGASVSGGVRVNAGGILIVCGSTINGGLASNGAAGIIFGAEEIDCAGDVVNGAVNITNSGPGAFPPPAPSIALERSVLNGSVSLSGNSGPIAVATNIIAGGLFCSGNAFDLEDEGSPSVVSGPVSCDFGGSD